jgi:single-strand DNA-binding protein
MAGGRSGGAAAAAGFSQAGTASAAPSGAADPRSTVNDTTVTVVGNVVDSPRRVSLQNGAVTNFRMASTARRYDAAQEAFVDSGTFWVDVECWGALSSNVSGSISKGDPVIVRGTLTTHSWETDNGRRSTPRIRAVAVGPNLARGTADFKRDRPARAAETVDRATGEITSVPQDEHVPDSPAELTRGRDYEDADDALNLVDADDLTAQPAHA